MIPPEDYEATAEEVRSNKRVPHPAALCMDDVSIEDKFVSPLLLFKPQFIVDMLILLLFQIFRHSFRQVYVQCHEYGGPTSAIVDA